MLALPRHDVTRVTVVIAFIYTIYNPVFYHRYPIRRARRLLPDSFLGSGSKVTCGCDSFCDNVARVLKFRTGEQTIRGAQLCEYQGGRELGLDSMANICESLQAS
jgi:hypothetical protein